MNKFQELTIKELKEIEGGKNIIEYISEGIGWLVGKIENAYDDFKEGWNSTNCNYK